MLPASEMLVPIYNSKSARLQEKDEVGLGEKEMEKKMWAAGVEEREGRGRRRKEGKRKAEEE